MLLQINPGAVACAPVVCALALVPATEVFCVWEDLNVSLNSAHISIWPRSFLWTLFFIKSTNQALIHTIVMLAINVAVDVLLGWPQPSG